MVQRIRFFSNLGALAAALLLIAAAAGFGPGALEGVGIGLGAAALVTGLATSALLVHHRPLDGEFAGRGFTLSGSVILAAFTAAVAAWEIISVTVFGVPVGRWLTLANGVVLAGLAGAGAVLHECSTQRVVYVLEVVERPRPETY